MSNAKYFIVSMYGNTALANINKDYLFIIVKTYKEAKSVKMVNNNYGNIREYDADGLRKELNEILQGLPQV